MAKVTLTNGRTVECTESVEQMHERVTAAESKKPPGRFVKCGGKYIAISAIVVIELQAGQKDDDDDGGKGGKRRKS